jgi:hypothetical protein
VARGALANISFVMGAQKFMAKHLWLVQAKSMVSLDKQLRAVSADLALQEMTTFIEKLVIQKLSMISSADHSELARAFAQYAARGDATEFDVMPFPGAGALIDQLELTEADVIELGRQMDQFHLSGVPEFVTKGINSAAKALFKQLNKGWSVRDKEELDLLAGFKLRQDELWGEAFRGLRLLLLCCREVGAERLAKLHKKRKQTDLDWALFRLHARGCLVASEVSALCENGFAHGAMARWRTLYELEVVALAIHQGGNEAASRFRDHAAIAAQREAASYEEHAPALGYRPMGKREKERIARNFDSAFAKHGKDFAESDYGWATNLVNKKRPKLDDIAKLASRKRMWPFVKLASNSVHSGSKALCFNVGLLEQGDVFLAGASNAGHADPIQLTADSLTTLTALLFHAEMASADTGAFVGALRLIADQTSKNAMNAHRQQLRNHKAGHKTRLSAGRKDLRQSRKTVTHD